MQIGNVTIPNNLILAPMAGVTDCHFVCCAKSRERAWYVRKWSAPKPFPSIIKIQRPDEDRTRERPVSLQLFGSDPCIISEMAAYIEDRPFDILDINMGCPVPKVAGTERDPP